MLISEAIQQVRTAAMSPSKKVLVVCSFEPLHLKTYLQAFLARRFPEETPEVVTFGYDRLHDALLETSSSLKIFPALFFLSWEDIHPSLSWRSRGSFGAIAEGELVRGGRKLRQALARWMEARRGAETYVTLPPMDWFPLPDACAPSAWGQTRTTAAAVLHKVAHELSRQGARVLSFPDIEMNFRDWLQTGCPLSVESSLALAQGFVRAAFPETARKKVIVTDADDTLWKGILSEDGADGLHCGPEEKGWPFWVFQKFLAKLKREGMLLALCSRNNSDALAPVFVSREMPLRMADFAAHRINWDPKPDNLVSLAQELHVGLDSFIFIDDDEAELALVRRRLPEVTTLRTPRDGAAWKDLFFTLQDLCATWRVSDEDRGRTASLQSRPVRAPGTASSWDHLKDLRLEVTFNNEAFRDPRALELINKTNQFNLTGERWLQDTWLSRGQTEGSFCVSARLKDCYGDFGTVCVAVGRVNPDDSLSVEQFVLSCRAFGRGVETVMLRHLLERSAGRMIRGPYKKTGHNEPVRMFLARLGGAPDPSPEWTLKREVVEKTAQVILNQTGMSLHG